MITMKRLGGYTLVEVTIVMAIAGGLGVLAFVGQAQLRSTANFNTGIQQIKTFVLNVKNEANTTVSLHAGQNGTTGNPYDSVFFGKALLFSDATPGVVTVSALSKDSAGLIHLVGGSDASTYKMPNGITYDYAHSSPQHHTVCIVYTRTEANANPVTYLIPDCDPVGNLISTASYTASNQAAYNITLTSPEGERGWLAVDPANGTLEETIR